MSDYFKKPFWSVLTSAWPDGEKSIGEILLEKGIQILGRIPFDHELGKLNSNAEIAVRKSEGYRTIFSSLLETVKREVQHEAASNSKR